jgi:diacylglycerol kinase family enzyme
VGADLIVSYGGDGTVAEVINGMVGRGVPLGLLPGGTGNGIATELGIPGDLTQALLVIAKDMGRRRLDLGCCGDRYFIQRAFVGLPEEFNPSRDLKDRIGFLAYPLAAARFLRESSAIHFRLVVDGLEFEEDGSLCLVNNVGFSNAKGFQDMVERLFLDVLVHEGAEVTQSESLVLDSIRPDDGLLDVLLITSEKSLVKSLASLVIRNDDNALARVHFFQGRHFTIEATPEQCVRLDGEDCDNTPVAIEVAPGAIEVLVPG